MGLSPQEMGNAIVRNLKAKTGRSLDEWLVEIKDLTYSDKKECIAYLKDHYGLGHFQAQSIHKASVSSATESAQKLDEKSLFKSKVALELYHATRIKIEQTSSSVRCKPCKTYIPFYARNKFAQIRPTSGVGISVEVYLPEGSNGVIAQPISKPKDKMTHSILIKKLSDLDTVFIEIIKDAISQ